MASLSKSTILYINQVRQANFEILIGKGFSEAFSWLDIFKKIIFICYSSTNKYIYRKIFDNCYLIGIPFDLSVSTLKSVLKIGQNYLKLYYFINKLIKKTHIDIIRIENLLISGLPAYLISKFKKIPYVMWLGGYERKSLNLKYEKGIITWILSKLIIFLEKIILGNANFVFPVTDELMDLANRRNVENKILSPNYVDVSKFNDTRTDEKFSPDKKYQILYVGRFEEEKGIKVLLDAIKLIEKKNSNIEFSLIGNGSLEGYINKFIKKNNLRNINLLGIFSHEEMPKLYNMADVFILPSFTEGSPASLIEAMSCGTPAIATSVGICSKFIKNGENGFLIPPGEPEKISDAIRGLISNEDLLKKFRIAGRETILKYTKNYAKIHRYVYDKILNQLND